MSQSSDWKSKPNVAVCLSADDPGDVHGCSSRHHRTLDFVMGCTVENSEHTASVSSVQRSGTQVVVTFRDGGPGQSWLTGSCTEPKCATGRSHVMALFTRELQPTTRCATRELMLMRGIQHVQQALCVKDASTSQNSTHSPPSTHCNSC